RVAKGRPERNFAPGDQPITALQEHASLGIAEAARPDTGAGKLAAAAGRHSRQQCTSRDLKARQSAVRMRSSVMAVSLYFVPGYTDLIMSWTHVAEMPPD